MATVLGLPVVIVGTLLLAGWLLGRRGVNLRMTGEGLEFPALPGMKSRRKLPWEETVAFHQLTAENLPPKGRDMMKLYDLIMGKPLALVIETACPVRDLPRSGALVRLLDQFGRTERRALIPDQMRDRAVLEFVIADDVPHDTVMDVLNRALGDRELRRRYCETAALYTIHQQAGEPVFVLLEATSE